MEEHSKDRQVFREAIELLTNRLDNIESDVKEIKEKIDEKSK
jgi:prefoldin subunit 5